jgi:hypothetical protein
MGAEPDDVRVRRSPDDGAYVIECRRPEALCPEMLRVVPSGTGAGWVIATPDGTPIAQCSSREQAIEYALTLVAGGESD